MTLHANLLHDGPSGVAQHVRQVTSCTRGPQVLCVKPNGRVRVVPLCKFTKAEDPAEIVGTYTRRTPVDVIESDCAERAKELAA